MPAVPLVMRAIVLANHGRRVFPCANKIPLTKNGFKDASRDLQQITDWWKTWPEAQIGLPTGRVNDLVVLDVDGPDGEAWLNGKSVPATREVETQPGKKHYWFKLPAGRIAKCSAGVLAPQIDVRGEGGYVIAPPSIHHESGKPYRFLNDLPLAEAPNWLLDEPIRETAKQPTNGNTKSGLVIHEGEGRHREALRLAGGLRARGANAEAILAALQIFSQQHCLPPLEQAWMQKTARYIETKPANFRGQAATARIEVQSFQDVTPELITWLWPKRIALGKLTLFAGDPGRGKSLVTLDIAARLSKGNRFPDGAVCEVGDTILLSAEDDAGDTVRPRLEAAGADLARVHRVSAVRVILADGAESEATFNLERDIEKLEESLARVSNARLLIVDPLTAYLGKIDAHRDAEVRHVLAPLSEIASRRRIAVIGVMHLRKSDTSALLRISGSIGFAAAARTIWGFGEDPDEPTTRVMTPVKNNLAPLGTGLAYQITAESDNAPFIVWDKEPVTLNADEILTSDLKEKRDRAKRQVKTEEWLRNLLAAGPVPSAQVESQAKREGLAWHSVHRVKDRIGVKTHKAGMASGWVWELPEDAKTGGEHAK